MDAAKVECIVKWPYPKSIKEVRGFLGLTGYYRRFVRHYGTIAQPITTLLKANSFEWNDEAKAAWDFLKHSLVTVPILALPDFETTFVVESDASNTGLGAILTQKVKPIAFFSKALSP